MKRYMLLLVLFLAVMHVAAQDKGVFAKGNKIYVENPSKNENAEKASEELVSRLKEWGYWQVVDNQQEADLKIVMDTKASKGITATSWGGTSFELTAQLTDQNDDVLWESNTYKSSPNGTNGFNSGRAVVKKLMRDLNKKFKD